MTLRIGDLVQSTRMSVLTSTIQQRIREQQAAIGSGKQAQSFADVATRASALIAGRTERTITATQNKENEQTLLRMRAMDVSLGSIGEAADRMRAVLVQRINGATGSDVPFASEIALALESVVSQLNLAMDGRYLFAGSRTGTAPVAMPSPPPTSPADTSYYLGDDVRLSTRAADGIEVTYGITANDPAIASLIAALGQAQAADLANDQVGLSAALDGLGQAIDGLANLRSALGSTAHRVEMLADQQQQAMLYLDELISGIEDTDLPTAVTRIAQDSAALEASYLVTSQISQLSLADYLR